MFGVPSPALPDLSAVSPTFRFFEKKRGARRTGSKFWGTVFEALFYLGLLLVGCVLLVWTLVSFVYPQWGANRFYLTTQGTVLGHRVIDPVREDAPNYQPQVQVEYTVDGSLYRTWTYGATKVAFPDHESAEFALRPFEVGGLYPTYYDPADPSRAVLVRDLSGAIWLFLIPPGALVVLGSVGLIYRVTALGKSTERRAAIAARRKNLELFDVIPHIAPEWPTVPLDDEVTNSPGIKLAYRLPIDTSPGWKLAGTALACVIWNVASALLASVALRDHLDGDPNWLLSALTLPFVAMGVWLVIYVIRLWVNTTGVGPPRVEISHHPLTRGKSYSLYLSLPQNGQLRFDGFTMSLVCEERCVYRFGTDAQSMSQKVYERLILGGDETTVRPNEAFEAEVTFTVPDTAMHSFRARNNSVEWKLLLRGRIKGWPDYERAYPIVVYPCCPRGGAA